MQQKHKNINPCESATRMACVSRGWPWLIQEDFLKEAVLLCLHGLSPLTVCLGRELPLRLLSEPALRCGGRCCLLRPGCGLPDPVVSNSPIPRPKTQRGGLGQASNGSHAVAWVSPPHPAAASGPGTGGAQPRLWAQAGLSDVPRPKSPRACHHGLGGLGVGGRETRGRAGAKHSGSFQRLCPMPRARDDPTPGEQEA